MQDAKRWWESRYAERDGVWSGRVNAVLASVAGSLPTGRALDLGCGEGGDVVWLAERGWEAVGLDISVTALTRASAAAARAGVGARTAFVAADLADWTTAARFDLVTASFLHSWSAEIPRDAILRRAAGFVAPGGRLLVTAHAAPPHGDTPESMRGHGFPTPDGDLAALGLDREPENGSAIGTWEVLEAAERPRVGRTPDGHEHPTVDSVVLVRRAG